MEFISIPTFVWAIINLLVLYFILRKLLFKPVTEFMENRQNSIRKSLDDAQRDKEEAVDLKNKYEDELKKADEQTQQIIKDAVEKAQADYDEIIKKARVDAEALRLEAKREIEIERNEMMKQIKNQVASLALEAASKVIEANMNTEANKKLVDQFINEQGVA